MKRSIVLMFLLTIAAGVGAVTKQLASEPQFWRTTGLNALVDGGPQCFPEPGGGCPIRPVQGVRER